MAKNWAQELTWCPKSLLLYCDIKADPFPSIESEEVQDLRTQKAKYGELCTKEPSTSMTFSESGEDVGAEAVAYFQLFRVGLEHARASVHCISKQLQQCQ